MNRLLVICFLFISLVGFSQTEQPSTWSLIKPQVRLSRINGKFKIQIDTVFNNHWANIATEKFVKDYVLTNSGATTKAFPTVAALKASSFYGTSGSLVAIILDGGASYTWDGSSTATDDGGITSIQVTGVTTGRWLKIFNGVVRALEAGIKNDGTDQSSAITALCLNTSVEYIKFDNGDFVVASKADFNNKTAVFENNSRIIGASGSSDTLTNIQIQADYSSNIFDTLLTVTNLRSASGIVSVRWFGANPDMWYKNTVVGLNGTPTDNTTPIRNAIAAMDNKGTYEFFPIKGALYFPSGQPEYWYKKTHNIHINSAIDIFGDGRATVIYSQAGDTIFTIDYVGNQTTSRYVWMHDLTLTQQTVQVQQSSDYFDAKSHGIVVMSNLNNFDRVNVEKVNGHCWLVTGNTPASNANNNTFRDISGNASSGCGWVAIGSDANMNLVEGGDFTGNSRWGYADSSFLGNTGLNIHTAANGAYNLYNKTGVTTGDSGFICKRDVVGVYPGRTSGWQTYWMFVGTGHGAAPPPFYFSNYSDTTHYLAGGGFYLTGTTNHGVLINPYAEGDEYAGINTGNTNVIGGFGGVSMDGGIVSMSFGNVLIKPILRVGVENGDGTLLMKDADNGFSYGWEGKGGWIRTEWAMDTANGNINLLRDGNDAHIGIINNAFTASSINRSAWPDTYNLRLGSGYFNKPFDEPFAHYRQFTTAWAKPTTGKWGDGDYIKNIGSDSTIAGWRVLTAGDFAGTPPVFIDDKTGNFISGSATLDFPSTTPQTSADMTIPVTGVSDGDVVSLGIPNSVVFDNSCYTAWVSASNTITVRFNNYDPANTRNPASATFKIKILK